MELNTPEKMLMALLRASLNEVSADVSYFQGATEDEWKQCYQLAVQQGVMALAWDGIHTLPKEWQLPCELKIVWAIAVKNYEKIYARYCRTIDELTALYAREGIATVQMKGVGLSTYYPIPSHREGGDIDIYTFSADKKRMTDEQANRLADELMVEKGMQMEMHSYKHSNFFYKGIPIENHKVFLNVKHYPIAAQADAFLQKALKPREASLLDGTCHIWIPSPEFNSIFLAFHASQHYGKGLALHHLCDWAILLKRHGLTLPDELKDKRFSEAISAFTQLCNRYLGTSVEVTGGESLADEMLKEILHPKFPHKAGIPVKGKWNILAYKTKRFLHTARTSNRILYQPLWKRIWISAMVHVRCPETIFR